MRERLLIVGNGMASVRFVEALLRRAPGRHAITVVGAEPAPGYNRVLLSALLAGDVSAADVQLRDRAWYEANGVTLVTGAAVASVDPAAREALLADGRAIAFDHLVFATGSNPIRLPLPGADKAGVITFRDLDDVAMLERAAAAGLRVAVIGGGLLGIEAAYGLARRGAEVSLVHVMDRLMERQLDAEAADLLRRRIEEKGISVLLGRQTQSIAGDDRATGLVFADGSVLEADLVVFAVGIRPNDALAASTGCAVARGVVVDDDMATSLPGVYAIGECASHRGVAYGLVEPAYAQAEALAAHLAGAAHPFTGMVLATNLKVSGVPVFSAGDFLGGEGGDCVTFRDPVAGVYRKLIVRDGRLTGCVLVGEAEDGLWYLDLIRGGTDIRRARLDLIHGRDFAEAALLDQAA
jgi:nitrite reductase (NADH) large subunit